jgi:senataxin
MTVDRFLEVTTMVPLPANKERPVSEGDIVIFSKGSDPVNQPGELHCLARTSRAKVKGNTMLEVVFRLNSVKNQLTPALIGGAELFGVKITNMATIEREYAALQSLQYYDLMDEVLKADISPMLTFGEEAIRNVVNNYQVNVGQAKAILNAKENDGFTLIQVSTILHYCVCPC